MAQKSFVTGMPDKSGMFLRASRIIAKQGGNITRVSYNRAVDPHMLFIDVCAGEEDLALIEKGLSDIGYIRKKIAETRIIEVAVKIPDIPGGVLPVLEVLNGYEISISYMNSIADGSPFQYFRFGLLIEDPAVIKTLLDEIGRICPVDVVECGTSEENLDNTVFYIRLANEMRGLLGISEEKSMLFLSESNRILQVLQAEGEDAGKVFGTIRRFARFISENRGERYRTGIERIDTGGSVVIRSIQPYCGSNTYMLTAPGELLLIDTGYAVFAGENLRLLKTMVPDWDGRRKRIYITHADVDHCGFLSKADDFLITVNGKSAASFARQAQGLPDYREQTALHLGYSRISRIISGYEPPDMRKLAIMDSGTPEEHDGLLTVGGFKIGDMDFTVYEGSGGHLYGEMIFVCRKKGIVFTGDILVNINGFSEERAAFNSLAPYLMKSVNVSPPKAKEVRRQVTELIREISDENKKPCVVCGGHGPVSEWSEGRLILASEASGVTFIQ